MCANITLGSAEGVSRFISQGNGTLELETSSAGSLSRSPTEVPRPRRTGHWPRSCRDRLLNGFPAGYLHVDGIFLLSHRDELERFLRDEGDGAAVADPRSRIVAWDSTDSQRLTVATATEFLALELGRALERAFQGEARSGLSSSGKYIRVWWHRD